MAIPVLNETSGTAIIARGMRLKACSPIAARHTGAAQRRGDRLRGRGGQPMAGMAALAATRLAERIENRPSLAPRRDLPPVSLVQRASTGPAPS